MKEAGRKASGCSVVEHRGTGSAGIGTGTGNPRGRRVYPQRVRVRVAELGTRDPRHQTAIMSATNPRVTGIQLGYPYPYPRRVNPSTRAGYPSFKYAFFLLGKKWSKKTRRQECTPEYVRAGLGSFFKTEEARQGTTAQGRSSGINSGNNNGAVKRNGDRKKLRDWHDSRIEQFVWLDTVREQSRKFVADGSRGRFGGSAAFCVLQAVEDEAAQGGDNPTVMVAEAVGGGFESASNPTRSLSVVNGEGEGETRLDLEVGTVDLEPTLSPTDDIAHCRVTDIADRGCVAATYVELEYVIHFLAVADLPGFPPLPRSACMVRKTWLYHPPTSRLLTHTCNTNYPTFVSLRPTPAVIDTLQRLPCDSLMLGSALLLLLRCSIQYTVSILIGVNVDVISGQLLGALLGGTRPLFRR
ncbi:hypothetical protein FB45DRAFT_879178 [Roridomyces roridus]|uniref:Uncharacterized protein n=1 Tax=Roridomyces roridus TaxID=1738132 RepID=A0AAD7F8R2_9AGAR|nr:hypothetical protein FB45DRAFT_879178 [Roridomyces roridus]